MLFSTQSGLWMTKTYNLLSVKNNIMRLLKALLDVLVILYLHLYFNSLVLLFAFLEHCGLIEDQFNLI